MRTLCGFLCLFVLGSTAVEAQTRDERASTVVDTSNDDVLGKAGNGEPILHPLSKVKRIVETGEGRRELPAMMAHVPTDEFTFGTGQNAKKVKLNDYGIGKFSVTNVEYREFLRAHPTYKAPRHWKGGQIPAGREAHPVVYVSLDDARAYAAWITKQTGVKTIIPTAEQWEHAARGPHDYLYPWGNSQDTSYRDGKLDTKFRYNAVTAAKFLRDEPQRTVTYNREKSPYFGQKTTVAQITAYGKDGRETPLSVSANGGVRGWVSHDTWTGFIYTDLFHELNEAGGDTAPVGSYEEGRSAYGCYDMAGNVWNWCDTQITATNGAEKGKLVHEIRGGSWYANGSSCRSTSIGEGRAARGAYNTVGFRIATPISP